tara:strand:+ start:2090 stop:3121 length:1032 start_codon:yes stop_codon:yes gene_type:complete
MKVKVISEIKKFHELQEDWNALFNTKKHTVFQSFLFNYYSWKFELNNNKNQLCLFLLYDKSCLTTIFPFYLDSKKRIRFINDQHADFCDILTSVEFDFDLFYSAFSKQINFNSFHLINLKKESSIFKLLNRSNLNLCIKSDSIYSILEVEKLEFPFSVARYKSKEKNEFRRIIKKHSDKISKIHHIDDSDFPSNQIFYLRNRMVENAQRKYNFLPDERIDLIENLYKGKHAVIQLIYFHEKPICCNIFLLNSCNEFLTWINLFDNVKMINIFSYVSFISQYSKDRSIVFNFGRGNYFYKTRNFKPDLYDLMQCYFFINKYHEFKFKLMYFISSFAKHIFKSIK